MIGPTVCIQVRQQTDRLILQPVMKDTPVISVVMPCYNEAKRISGAVQSVFEQTFRDLELIVVDDGSRDDSLQVIAALAKRYPRLKYFSQENRGPGPARNLGLRQASGEYIAFLDADDAWHPQCLERLHATLSRHPDAALTYCGWQNLGVPENRGKPFIPPDYERPDKIEVMLRGCRWPIHAALTRKASIDAIGGFDEQWSTSMDYDLWLNLASFHEIVLTPEVLAYYHHHEGEQITKNRLRIAINHTRIQQHFLDAHPEVIEHLGKGRVRRILMDELLQRAYVSYWDRDLDTAHVLFRKMLGARFFGFKDLKYALPALLPLPIYRRLVRALERQTA